MIDLNQFFIDENNNIYVIDKNNVIYYYLDNILVPFYGDIENITNCKYFNGCHYISTNSAIYLFSNELILLNTMSVNNPILIVKNYEIDTSDFIIDFMQFDIIDKLDDKFLILLYQSNTMNSNKSYRHIYQNFTDIFLSNTNIVMCKDLFKPVQQIIRFDTLIDIFNSFVAIDKSCTKVFLSNGSIYHLINQSTNKFDKYILDDFMHSSNILMFYEENLIKIIHKKKYLISMVEVFNNENICVENIGNDYLISKIKANVITNSDNWLFYSDKIINISDISNLLILNLSRLVIKYDYLIEMFQNKSTDDTIYIDIDPNKNIVTQLLNIIPNLYRLNMFSKYHFEQVDQVNNIVTSYGPGVIRQILDIGGSQLDNIINNYNSNAISVGKLLAFIFNETNIKFKYIHPYFFFLLSNSGDYENLLRRFKESDYDNFYQQYLRYIIDPKELIRIDLPDVLDANDFIRYIFSCDLTDSQITYYNNLYNGFMYFHRRLPFYTNVILHLPIEFYLGKLLDDKNITYKLIYEVDQDTTITETNYLKFIRIFSDIYSGLNIESKRMIAKQTTGSKYFTGDIHIIYQYKDSTIIQNTYSGEIIDEDIDHIPVSTNLINLEPRKKDYTISTCNASLYVNIPPTYDTINNLIEMLAIADSHMVN